MQITTTKLNFSKAINSVVEATLKRGDNAVLKSILLEADKEKEKIFLRATDTTLEISSWFDGTIDESFSLCFDPFVYGIVQNLGDEIVLTLNGNILNVKSGNSVHDFNIIPAERFPEKQNITGYKKMDDFEQFVQAIELCSTCVDHNTTEDFAKTYKIDFSGKKIITTNKKKVSIFDINLPYTGEAIIPAKMFEYVLPKLKNATSVEFSLGDWCGFKTNEFEIAINTFKINFPNVVPIVSSEKSNTPKFEIEVATPELNRVLSVCQLYEKQADQNNQDSFTVLKMDNEVITISVEIENFSRMSEPITCIILNPQVTEYEIWFNSTELLKLIQVVPCDTVKISFFENKKAFFVYGEGLDNYTYLQMPYIKTAASK